MANLGRGNMSGPGFNFAIAADTFIGEAVVAGYLQGINVSDNDSPIKFVYGIAAGGAMTPTGDGRNGPRYLSPGVEKSTTEGDPAQPCLKLTYPGMWRFRWLVQSGARTITINVKQAANATPYPTMVVKANPACGVNADVTGTSPGGAGWVTIGPVNVNPTSNGSLWVELWNNYTAATNSPAYFDHIVVT